MANVEIKIIGHNDKPTIWYNTLVGEILTVNYPFIYDRGLGDRIKLLVGSLPPDILRKADFTFEPEMDTPIYIFVEDFCVLKAKSELETILEQLDKEVGTAY